MGNQDLKVSMSDPSCPPLLIVLVSRVEKPGLYQLRDQEPLPTWSATARGRIRID